MLRRGLLLAQLVATAAVLRRLGRGRTRRPPLEARRAQEPVTVLVPARDEEARLAGVLAPLRDDPDVREVVVVDDRSSDATAAVACEHGARVVDGADPPVGWIGKPWALEQGLRTIADDEVVVCLDADCEPRAGLLGALRAALDEGEGWHLVTGGVRFRCEGRAERMLHPALLATLLVRFGALDGEDPPPPSRLLANGQCVCFRAGALKAAGGFAEASGHLTDDVALARGLARRGWRIRFADASDLLAVRMYEGTRDTWRGWGRSIALADVTPPLARGGDVLTVWLVLALPPARALARRATKLDLALLALRAALLAATARAYAPRGPWYWLSPLADLPAAVRLTLSAVRPSREWRGRIYGP